MKSHFSKLVFSILLVLADQSGPLEKEGIGGTSHNLFIF